MATQASLDLAQELYVAYYGRPADPAGQTFWADAFDAAGDDLTDALAAFGTSSEFTDNFGGLDNAGLINNLYTQLFGHTADAEGLAFYEARLDSGEATLASIAKQIADGALGDDETALTNKVTVANTYTDTISSTGETYGTGDIADAQAILAAVDATAASVTAGNAAATTEASPPTFTVTGSATQADEGETLTFTVTASKAVDADTAFTFGVSGDTVDGVATAASTNDYTPASGTVTIAEGDSSITFDVSITADQTVENLEGIEVVVLDSTLTTIGTARALLQDGDDVGATFTLTTGVDTVAGSAQDDTIVGSDTTITALDTIDGGDGNDTLTIDDLAGAFTLPGSTAISNVENVVLRSTGTVTFNSTTMTGVDSVSTTLSTGGATVTSAATTAVTVSGAAGGAVVVDGGSTVDVTAAATTAAITIGGTTGPAGAITATHAAQAANAIAVSGGTSVDVTAGGATTGTVTVGGVTAPTGAVTVGTTGAASTAGTDVTLGTVTTTGGSTVDITRAITAGTAVATDTKGATHTQGAVSVTAGTATTTVNVSQDAVVAEIAAQTAVAGVTESNSVVYTALTAGQTLIHGGLTFTAGAAGTTAAQTAAAFANLANGDIQGASTLGAYAGTFTGWSTGAASGTGSDTVVFTSSAAGNVADLAAAGTGAAAATITKTEGSAATAGVTGVLGITQGAVAVVDGKTTDTIATVTIDGYASASVSTDALTSLSLSNSTAAAGVAITSTTTALDLTLNNVTGGGAFGLGATTSSLDITASTAASAINVTGAGVTALAVDGDAALNLTGSTLAALQTVTVSGSAGLTLVASGATVTGVDASATSGSNTITVDATKATYTGGTGVDTVTLSAAAPSKAVDLGDGNDKLVLAGGTTATTGTLAGGSGTDTLSIAGVDAATADNTAAFATAVTGFERVEVTGGGTNTIELDDLGNYNDVETNGNTALTLNAMSSGGTLTLDGAGTAVIVNVTDAATGTSDSLNVTLSSAGAIAAGTVTAANVESIALTATDTDTTAHADTLTLVATKATAVTVAGNASLTLTNTGNTAQSSIDASAMTGALTVTAAGTTVTTITGGAGADVLTASTGTVADVLIGGAGDDTLTGNAGLGSLTGGAGDDTFAIGVATANVNTYTTITDAAAGDEITFLDHGTETFQAAGITLADTAVFQDYANAAVNAGGDASANGYISWFQYGGDTYIVESRHDATTTADFANGTDMIVKLSGLVDLSSTSLNTDAPATLLIG